MPETQPRQVRLRPNRNPDTDRKPRPTKAGPARNVYPHTPTTNPATRTQTDGPQSPTRKGEIKAKTVPTRTNYNPRPRMARRGQKPKPEHTQDRPYPGKGENCKRQMQTRAPYQSRKPSVHSPDTNVARAMLVTQRNLTWSLVVRRFTKAGGALGLGPERATPKHPGTKVRRPCR